MKYFVLIFVFYVQSNFAQNKSTVYISFDSKSEKTYNKEVGNGEFIKEDKYVKNIRKGVKENIRFIKFYIKDELFELDSKEKIDTCSVDLLKGKKRSSIDKLKEVVKNGNSFYPWKNFEKVYLVENYKKDSIIVYNVKWVYYIE